MPGHPLVAACAGLAEGAGCRLQLDGALMDGVCSAEFVRTSTAQLCIALEVTQREMRGEEEKKNERMNE